MGPFLVRTGQRPGGRPPSPSLPPNPATSNGRGNRSARPARPTQTGCEPVSPRGPGSPPATSAQRGRVASRARPSAGVLGGEPPSGSGVAPEAASEDDENGVAKRSHFCHTRCVACCSSRGRTNPALARGNPYLFSCCCCQKGGVFMVASIASKRRVSCHTRGFAVERAPPTLLARGNPETPRDSQPRTARQGARWPAITLPRGQRRGRPRAPVRAARAIMSAAL